MADATSHSCRSFLFCKDGNPNKRNVHNETALHLLCMGPQIMLPEGALHPRLARPHEDEQRRADCLQLILKWTGAKLDQGEYERANVNATDAKKSTCLHYAAASGMKTCVEYLVKSNADLFAENESKETPCDCAEKQHHRDLALSLEAQMVFSKDPEAEDIEAEYAALDRKEAYEGLKLQDLRRLKDMLIVETADMLQAPLFTAEALLRAHDWDREKLLEAWMSNAEDCCQRSGVHMPTPPPSGCNAWDTLPSPRTPRTTRSSATSPDEISLGDEGMPLCGICMCTISVFEDPVDMPCGHEFCRACWEGFLNMKIQEGEAHNIFCPAHDCFQLVPVEVIESVVSREMDKRYLQFDIKAFVENNPAIKWCPTPGCERAVRLNRVGPGTAASDPLSFPLLRAPAVDCGKSHLFCWECLGEAHEPCECQTWNMWLQKVSEMKPEELAGVSEAYEDAANCLWLLTNSKPCANCKSPIQKNEGCNHMQCAKCKYDFCWICLEEWKKHSSSTGGYYRCTRYEVIQQVEEQSKEMTVEAEKKHKSFQELDRFMHYYTRYKNHEHSYQVIFSLTWLLHLPQTDLEMVTEDLAQKVNRPYLRTPRHKIIRDTCLVQQKRQEFLASVARGVAPNDSPEAPRRSFAGGTWDWEYLGFASPEEYAEFQHRRRHRQRRRGDIHSLRSSTPEPDDPGESILGASQIWGGGLRSLDEDDPNILLAIQLSLQESGLAMGGDTQEFLNNEASLGAIGTSLPSRLEPAPHSIEVPRAAMSSSELLELGDSLMRLGNASTQYTPEHFSNLQSFGEPPGGLFSSSSDTDSACHDPSANANLLGNIMAWFHDMNPQSIALIPSASSEPDLDVQGSNVGPKESLEPQTELREEGEEDLRKMVQSPPCPTGEDTEPIRPTQLELEGVVAVAGPDTEPDGGETYCSGDFSHTNVPECDSDPNHQQCSSASPDWEEQVHLV
ncbi:ankyrin repeat and IBR domain-containing protein 1-like [Scleropages formosus]|uniref:RBR-type E3 ubiquitin transferase n=1 Tax=Scleropages formosus TaxID=113540 RepID=A0A0P7ZA18_SCLFO|nr:ankyrin repeat and IBR domain-containing protein 1-like [Scleropages formosus]